MKAKININPKAKRLLILLFLIGGGGLGASVIVFKAVFAPKRKPISSAKAFGSYLSEQQNQDQYDENTMPEELLRAQRAKQAGSQFSSANYGKGSLGYVRGSLPGGDQAKEGSGKEGEGGSGGAGAPGMGGAPGQGKLAKGEGGLNAKKSAFDSGGGSRFMGDGAAGGAGQDKNKGKGLREAGQGQGGGSGKRSGRLGLARFSKMGKKLGRDGLDGSKSAIADLKKRAQFVAKAGPDAQYQAGSLDMAMAGAGGGEAVVDGLAMDEGGLLNSELPEPEVNAPNLGEGVAAPGATVPDAKAEADGDDYCIYTFNIKKSDGGSCYSVSFKTAPGYDSTTDEDCSLNKIGGPMLHKDDGTKYRIFYHIYEEDNDSAPDYEEDCNSLIEIAYPANCDANKSPELYDGSIGVYNCENSNNTLLELKGATYAGHTKVSYSFDPDATIDEGGPNGLKSLIQNAYNRCVWDLKNKNPAMDDASANQKCRLDPIPEPNDDNRDDEVAATYEKYKAAVCPGSCDAGKPSTDSEMQKYCKDNPDLGACAQQK